MHIKSHCFNRITRKAVLHLQCAADEGVDHGQCYHRLVHRHLRRRRVNTQKLSAKKEYFGLRKPIYHVAGVVNSEEMKTIGGLQEGPWCKRTCQTKILITCQTKILITCRVPAALPSTYQSTGVVVL